MKNKIKITISGITGIGKSTITYLLKEFLVNKGFNASYDGGLDYKKIPELFNHLIGSTISERENAIKSNLDIDFEEVLINKKLIKDEEILIRDSKLDSLLTTELIYGRVIDIDNDLVYVECIVDEKLEKRKFNKDLFSNIKDFKINSFVSISYKTSPRFLLILVDEIKEDISFEFDKISDQDYCYYSGLPSPLAYIDKK
jgi:hypothetical protein